MHLSSSYFLKTRTLIILLCAAASCLSPCLAAQPAEFSVGDFSFVRPAIWEWISPSSPMRKAHLRVPAVEGDPEDAEILFFHFGPGQGGSIEANISRWLGQFVEPIEQLNAQRAEESLGETKRTFLQANGTYLAGMPGQAPTPKENYALRGAILSSANGDVFIKMTGPRKTVESAAATFDAMVIEAAK